ncbi:large ribosomal RNA subunit accumulation protein YCED homolog 1, chloroplastic [Elaeis guineensis]|uniref:Large ribosomal RNA subunit accumulation protein YCED homolog 1, chloroplastic n=1 Tax=Elaeis guineensis var. tenera TaxID=51953 RepID=A0A6I9S903_ELAGV|nr:large ribosomal RNA subunit accumulation protein YCED homolog 1, chloroplastic [Elaeis guineensis]
MALLFPSSSLFRSPLLQTIRTNPHAPKSTLFCSILNPKPPFLSLTLKSLMFPSQIHLKNPSFLLKASSFTFSEATDFATTADGVGDEDEDLASSPWEGAVVYRRDASVTHLEYSTTLERLGLGKLSSGLSRSRASAMGIRLPARRGKEAPFGDGETPVLISVDVTRRKRRLKLDGIVRTVITLGCNRCAEPAAECVFSNFTLLLTEDPIEEPDVINMGVIYGEDKAKTSTESSHNEEEDDEKQIDLDDRLYFPAEKEEIDLSKHIRDIVHVEITINAICDANCKGLCLKCGTNLNKRKCNCKEVVQDKGREYGPLKGLKKQMQQG